MEWSALLFAQQLVIMKTSLVQEEKIGMNVKCQNSVGQASLPNPSLLLAKPSLLLATPHLYWSDPSFLLAKHLTSIGNALQLCQQAPCS